MIFNLLVLLLIVLITLYLATQGMVSALLALVTSTFSSLLAMALTEPLEFLVGKVSVEYQRGVTFLVLFLLVFAITRVVSDILVPKTIKVPVLVNRAIGGLVGFFTALVVMGTLVIGIEMMPLPSTLLGYDRFPGENSMQGETPGSLGRSAGVWLAPDRFTLALWNAASGRSLGGTRSFSSVHPDLSVESYGFRRNVQYASKHTVPPEALAVSSLWMSNDPKDLDPLKIKLDAGKRAVVARTVITKGEKPARSAADVDDTYFRVTPSEVRLVTDKGHQYFPIGYLEFGTTFVPLDLDKGQLVDDFVKGKVVEDWVFQIADDEKPDILEIKQTARKEGLAASVKDKPQGALAAADYPQKPYRKERSELTLTVSGIPSMTEGKVYVLRQAAPLKDVIGEVQPAYDHVLDVLKAIEDNTGGWSNADKPGVPNRSYFQSARQVGLELVNKDRKEAVEWNKIISLCLAGQMQSDPDRTLNAIPAFVNNTLVPMFGNISNGNAVIASGPLDASGKVDLRDIPKGDATIFAFVKTDKGVFAWVRTEKFDPFGGTSQKAITLSANDATVKIER